MGMSKGKAKVKVRAKGKGKRKRSSHTAEAIEENENADGNERETVIKRSAHRMPLMASSRKPISLLSSSSVFTRGNQTSYTMEDMDLRDVSDKEVEEEEAM